MDTSILERFRRRTATRGDAPAFRSKAGGRWIARSWRDWEGASFSIAAALVELGVRSGDRVVVLCSTRREWAEADLGILLAGAVTVPVSPQCTVQGLVQVLEECAPVVVFAEDPMQLEKCFAPEVKAVRKSVRRVLYLDAHRRLQRPDARGRLEVRLEDVVAREERSMLLPWGELLAVGTKVFDRHSAELSSREKAITDDAPATVVYTSGTTGPQRGVVLTHGNLAFELSALAQRFSLDPSDEQLFFLPLSHIFGRVLLLSALDVGFVTCFASSPLSALQEAREVHPTFLAGVPRVFEKIHNTIMQQLREESPVRRRAGEAALAVGRKYAKAVREGRDPGFLLTTQYRAAEVAVLERVREVFGQRLRFAVSGGAALSLDVVEWFHGCGIPLLEGYGLTETTAATHVNTLDAFKLGTVGRALPGVSVRIADDGEVLVRGENVMAGYFLREEETRAVLEDDGWFHTGDVGLIDYEGYLTITDRKKDLLVTAGGKNVAPQSLEAVLRGVSWIADAAVFGEGKSYLVALLSLERGEVEAWARSKRVEVPWDELVRHPLVREELGERIRNANRSLEQYQQLRRWAVVSEGFRMEDGTLTETLKIRRRALGEKHQSMIEALYR